jgi:hypothetical protein
MTGTTGGTGMTGTTGGTGTTGSTGTATAAFTPYSAVGQVSLSDNGNFVVTEWIYSNGTVQAVTANGTYSVSQDCSLKLTFASGTAGGGNVSFSAPVTFTGTLNRAAGGGGRTTAASSGSLVIQPANVTTVVGRFIAQ